MDRGQMAPIHQGQMAPTDEGQMAPIYNTRRYYKELLQGDWRLGSRDRRQDRFRDNRFREGDLICNEKCAILWDRNLQRQAPHRN